MYNLVYSMLSSESPQRSSVVKRKTKGVIQSYLPLDVIKQEDSRHLSPASLLWQWAGVSLNTEMFYLMDAFCLTGLQQTKWLTSQDKERMGCLCYHTEAHSLTVNTTEHFSLDSYEHSETQFVGYYSYFSFISKVDIVCIYYSDVLHKSLFK